VPGPVLLRYGKPIFFLQEIMVKLRSNKLSRERKKYVHDGVSVRELRVTFQNLTKFR
jgi:hypothetical protein